MSREEEISKEITDFLGFVFKVQKRLEKDSLKVGDRVTIDEPIFMSYFVPKGAKVSIGANYTATNKHLVKYMSKAVGIVVEVNLDFKFNCGHCSKEHTHDMLVNYPELGVTYYCKENEFTLVEKE